MITGHDFYTVMSAMVPLYIAMILAFGSVRWWKILSPDQCSGINRFVAIFAVPLLSFHFISLNNPFQMNFRFIAADTLQKIIVLLIISLFTRLTNFVNLEWLITLFSLSTLPNTLVMGIPLLIAMYGDDSGSLMVQVVVMQCIVWYTLLLFLFEYRGAKMLIMEQFPETAGEIVEFKVESDVVSLDGQDFLETDAEIGDDGKLHVTVRKSNVSRRSLGLGVGLGFGIGSGTTPRPSNLTGAEIYSLSSTPRGSNFNHSDFYSMMGFPGGRLSNFGPADAYNPRSSNFDESAGMSMSSPRFGFYPAATQTVSDKTDKTDKIDKMSYPAPNPEIASAVAKTVKPPLPLSQPLSQNNGSLNSPNKVNSANQDAKELHMFTWSSNASPVSERGGLHVFGSGGDQSGRTDQPAAKEIRMTVGSDRLGNSEMEKEGFNFANDEGEKEGPIGLNKVGSSSTAELHPKGGPMDENGAGKQMPPASVVTRLILIMVWRKLIRNPNTYSSLIGLIWSLVSFRWDLEMPMIIGKSISLLSDAGLGMAMFSLGLFMALQPKIIACGNSLASMAMAFRFLAGPFSMWIASLAVGLRGTLLHVAIVQAALPQGIVPFVFAKEYNVHPAILSTAVIFGMLIALPITLVYYIVLGL